MTRIKCAITVKFEPLCSQVARHTMVKFEAWKPANAHETTRVYGNLNGPDGILAKYSVDKLRTDLEVVITDLEIRQQLIDRTTSDAAEVLTSLDRQCNMLHENQAKYDAIVASLESRLDVISRGFTACASVLELVKKNNILTPFEERLIVVEEKQVALSEVVVNIQNLEDRILNTEYENTNINTKTNQTNTLLTGAYLIGILAICMATLHF